jgi:hypothetical protein
MNAKIKYKIRDANSTFLATEIIMTTQLYNPLNVDEALNVIKKHYKERAIEGQIKINLELDKIKEKDNTISISEDIRKQLFNDFYFYDEETIKIISINDLAYEVLEKIEFEVAERRLKEKLESLSTPTVKTKVDKLLEEIKLLNYCDTQELISRIKSL